MNSRGRVRVSITAVLLGLLLGTSPSLAAINAQFFVSANNNLYYVVASDSSAGSVGTQVTSLIMTSGTPLSVPETKPISPDPDNVVTAFSTFLTGGFLDPPVSNIQRTGVITGLSSNHIENMGNPLNGNFDPLANGGRGLLTLPVEPSLWGSTAAATCRW